MNRNDPKLPRWIIRFLEIICPEYLYEEIEGDLIQHFNHDRKKHGERKAKWNLVWNALRFLRPGIIRRHRHQFRPNPMAMFFNHIKLAIRIFWKDKVFTVLNISSLSLGIAVSILLFLILQSDLTYDKHYAMHDRIFRVGCHQQQTGLDIRWARSAMDLGDAIRNELPEIQEVVRIDDGWPRQLVTFEDGHETRAFYENGIVDVDSNYFKVFNHHFLFGNPETSLRGEHSAVVTASTSRKYFGSENPIGKTLIIDKDSWIITGVIEDLPENTHLKFDFLLSNRQYLSPNAKFNSENFWNPGVYLYILAPKGYTADDFMAKFPIIYDKYFKPFSSEVGGKYTPILERLSDIHFHSGLDQDEPHGSLVYVYALAATGFLIVLMACINYMNLSTAKSVSRSVEIAIKKLVGMRQVSLKLSILSESILLSLLSLVIGYAMVYVIINLNVMEDIVGKSLRTSQLMTPNLIVTAFGIAMVIGLLGGLYPSFQISSLPMMVALKGRSQRAMSDGLFRKVLITIQFTISLFVIVSTGFMGEQIAFVRNKSLGFKKDNLMVLPIQDTTFSNQMAAIRQKLSLNPHVMATSTSDGVVGLNVTGSRNFWIEHPEGTIQMGFTTLFVGDDFMKTMGLELLEGHDFQSGPVPPGETPYIINEAAAKQFGWTEQPLEKEIKFFHGEIPGHVIGVVKDFNFRSLHNPVEPLLIIKWNENEGYLQIRIDNRNLDQTIAFVKTVWDAHDPVHPFEFFFLDQRFDEQYKSDVQQNRLLSSLSYISVFISLLGLLGLSAYAAIQRTREIGVRKVLGASTQSIIMLLSRDIILLVALSSVIAMPLSWSAVKWWMEDFAFKTNLNYARYPLVTLVTLVLVVLVILVQSMKQASRNPTEALKHE